MIFSNERFTNEMMVILEVFFIRFGWFSSFVVAYYVHTMDSDNTIPLNVMVPWCKDEETSRSLTNHQHLMTF